MSFTAIVLLSIATALTASAAPLQKQTTSPITKVGSFDLPSSINVSDVQDFIGHHFGGSRLFLTAHKGYDKYKPVVYAVDVVTMTTTVLNATSAVGSNAKLHQITGSPDGKVLLVCNSKTSSTSHDATTVSTVVTFDSKTGTELYSQNICKDSRMGVDSISKVFNTSVVFYGCKHSYPTPTSNYALDLMNLANISSLPSWTKYIHVNPPPQYPVLNSQRWSTHLTRDELVIWWTYNDDLTFQVVNVEANAAEVEFLNVVIEQIGNTPGYLGCDAELCYYGSATGSNPGGLRVSAKSNGTAATSFSYDGVAATPCRSKDGRTIGFYNSHAYFVVDYYSGALKKQIDWDSFGSATTVNDRIAFFSPGCDTGKCPSLLTVFNYSTAEQLLKVNITEEWTDSSCVSTTLGETGLVVTSGSVLTQTTSGYEKIKSHYIYSIITGELVFRTHGDTGFQHLPELRTFVVLGVNSTSKVEVYKY